MKPKMIEEVRQIVREEIAGHEAGYSHIADARHSFKRWILRPVAKPEVKKPVTRVIYWNGMARKESYSFTGEPDIGRIKRELRFGEMDGAWVIEVGYNKTKKQMKCSRVNDMGGTNIIDRINAYWTRTFNGQKIRVYEAWHDDVWFIWDSGRGVLVCKDIAMQLDIPICPKSVHKGDMRPPK